MCNAYIVRMPFIETSIVDNMLVFDTLLTCIVSEMICDEAFWQEDDIAIPFF